MLVIFVTPTIDRISILYSIIIIIMSVTMTRPHVAVHPPSIDNVDPVI